MRPITDENVWKMLDAWYGLIGRRAASNITERMSDFERMKRHLRDFERGKHAHESFERSVSSEPAAPLALSDS